MNRRSGRRRRAGALAVLALLGCGDDELATPGSTATTAAATTVLPGGPGPTSTTASPGPGPTGGSGGPTSTTAGAPGGEGRPPASLDVGGVGDFAPALLRPELSERLVVEVHADVAPRPATLEHLTALLGDAAGKPVSIVSAGAPGGGDRAWTARELAAAADAGSTTAQGGGVAVVRLLFVGGSFEGDDGVLGVAVRGDVAALFLDRIDDTGGLLGGSGGIEAAVAAHELGHLLGLVDLHRDTGRDDPEHPGHSRSRGSVMYWAVESSVVGELLGADPPRHFDDDDRADLAAIRAGA